MCPGDLLGCSSQFREPLVSTRVGSFPIPTSSFMQPHFDANKLKNTSFFFLKGRSRGVRWMGQKRAPCLFIDQLENPSHFETLVHERKNTVLFESKKYLLPFILNYSSLSFSKRRTAFRGFLCQPNRR